MDWRRASRLAYFVSIWLFALGFAESLLASPQASAAWSEAVFAVAEIGLFGMLLLVTPAFFLRPRSGPAAPRASSTQIWIGVILFEVAALVLAGTLVESHRGRDWTSFGLSWFRLHAWPVTYYLARGPFELAAPLIGAACLTGAVGISMRYRRWAAPAIVLFGALWLYLGYLLVAFSGMCE